MTWGLAQAGNRAGRTGRYLQWWESEPEWNAVTSALQNPYDAASFFNVAMLQGCHGDPTLLRMLPLPLLLRLLQRRLLPRRARCAWQGARRVQRMGASEQARGDTAPIEK